MNILCKDDLKKAVRHAKSMGNKTLGECLTRMHEREKRQGVVYNIYTDRAPLSFYFVCMRGEHMDYNGGIIFHGPHDGFGNGSAPTFSVCIDKSDIGWRIHT